MAWTRALHFKQWADTQEARHTLPWLLRRLVRAVLPREAKVLFPAGEEVQRPGFDGIVESSHSHQFVPSGRTTWEMGVSHDPKGKADGDYDKRVADTPADVRHEMTFVFVTPRDWLKKDDWAKEKVQTGDWKNVLVFDANDLEHWIDLCPSVDVWFSTLTGRRPPGLIDLSARWRAISQRVSKK